MAAVVVMLAHAIGDIAYHGGPKLFRHYFVGAAGVDLFFVVSGFVMVYSAGDLFGRRGAWAGFLRKRLARIVPLYWIATLAYCLVQIAQGKWAVVRPLELAMSLAFWPHPGPDGLSMPVYSIGWTLNDEMFFYVVFAAGLLFRRRHGLALVVASLLGLVALGSVTTLPQPLRFWSEPVLIDFLFGIGAGVLYIEGWRMPSWAAALAAGSGVALLGAALWAGYNFVPGVPDPFPRWLVWGLPCALMFTGVVLRREAPARPHRMLAYYGNASYAVYLLHPLVIIMMRPLLPRLQLLVGDPATAGLLQVLCIAGVVLAGSAALHSAFERPVTRFLSGGVQGWICFRPFPTVRRLVSRALVKGRQQ